VQVEGVDLVVAVPLNGRCRVASSDTMQHDRVTLDDGRVHRTNLEPWLHCNRPPPQTSNVQKYLHFSHNITKMLFHAVLPAISLTKFRTHDLLNSCMQGRRIARNEFYRP